MTFSIVAVDKEAGETGFAIASCCWGAGSVCMARPEGAIASQANGNVAFLGLFFERLGEGLTPQQIMDHFRDTDPEFESRQVGMITRGGEKAAFTGPKCSFWAGHRQGSDYSCQGNILVGQEVIDQMASAFEAAEGPLFERLFAALEAADAAGGDARGRQSARLLVSRSGSQVPIIDIRIEDNENPVKEMARTLNVRGNIVHILGMIGKLDKADGVGKLAILEDLRTFLDDKREPRYLDWWEALADGYYRSGRIDKAVDCYRAYLAISPGMEPILKENARAGNFPMELADALGL